MENNDKYIGTLLDDRYEILQVIGEGVWPSYIRRSTIGSTATSR